MNTLVCVIGTIMIAFFIAVVNISIEPHQCVGHPNGIETVHHYTAIICSGGSEHRTIVMFSAMFLILPLTFVVCCGCAVYQFPKRMVSMDTEFLHSFAFLFFRFRPGMYWYVLIFIFRNMFIALFLLASDPAAQMIIMVALLLVSIFLNTRLLPWQSELANYMDSLISMCLVDVMCRLGVYVESANSGSITHLCVTIISVVGKLH